MDRSYPIPLALKSESATLLHADTLSIFGQLDHAACKILKVFLNESSIRLQLQITWPNPACLRDRHENASSQRNSRGMPQHQLQVNIYGAKHLFESVGTFVSKCGYFLQQPKNCDRNVEYCNPHCVSPESPKRLFTNDLEDFHEPDTFHANRLYLSTNPIDAFMDASSSSMLPETDTPCNLKTQLYRHQKQALTFMVRREEGWAMEKTQQDIWECSKDAAGRLRYFLASNVRRMGGALTVQQLHKHCNRACSEKGAGRISGRPADRRAWSWKNPEHDLIAGFLEAAAIHQYNGQAIRDYNPAGCSKDT